jgi:hypothetical protein
MLIIEFINKRYIEEVIADLKYHHNFNDEQINSTLEEMKSKQLFNIKVI